jgi:hypothetical protein
LNAGRIITCFERGILTEVGADSRLDVGVSTRGCCSKDIPEEAAGEAATEPTDDESDNMLPEASLSSASSELSSASVILSASPGIRLCLVTFGARSESFTGKGAAKTSARPEWLINWGLPGKGEVPFAAVDEESGDSGAVVDITGMGMPPYVVSCDSGIICSGMISFMDRDSGRFFFDIE